MIIDTYKNLDNKDVFFNFCRTQSLEKSQPASINMWHDNWITQSHTLPYILENTDRFNGVNGNFFIVWDNNEIVACGGVYVSNFNPMIGIAGVRTWVKKECRHMALNKDYLLVEHKKWCLKRQLKIVALTFNEYNKNIIQIFKRNRLGEKIGRISNRKPENMFYNGLHELPYPVYIQYSKQYVIYEKLDENFEFDWTTIQCK